MTIIVDFDDVLIPTNKSFKEYWDRKYNTNIAKRVQIAHDWSTIFETSRDQIFEEFTRFTNSREAKKIQPFTYASQVLTTLAQYDTITILSDRSPHTKGQIEYIVDRYFSKAVSDIQLTAQQKNLNGRKKKIDVVREIGNVVMTFEDAYHHAIDYHNEGICSFLKTTGHNKLRTFPSEKRFENWKDVYDRALDVYRDSSRKK